jgi:Zn-dependent protease with chaperone function
MSLSVKSMARATARGFCAALLMMLLFAAPVVCDSLSVDSAEPQDATALTGSIDEADADGEDDQYAYPMSPERKAKLIDYSRFKNIWRFVDFLLGIAILSLILFTGLSARMRNWAGMARLRFFVVWLFFVLFLLADYVLNLPFHLYRGFLVESNYGFMNQSFLEWWGEDLLGLFILAIIGIIPAWFLYWLIGKYKKWWLVFSIGAIPFLVLFIVIAPVVISPLFNKFEPLKDKQLESEITSLASKAGIEGADIFQVDGSKQSSKINAYVTGLFGSKRIVLYDTMIENFSTDELKYVIGHEMGHYIMHHIWWGLSTAIVFIAFCLWLTNRTIHGVITRFRGRFKFDKLGDVASLPLIMIFISVFSFVFQPVTNGASRYMERKADRYGMDITGVSGESAAIAFDKLSVYNLSDPDPNATIEFWFYDHPALKKRMEFVRGYRH